MEVKHFLSLEVFMLLAFKSTKRTTPVKVKVTKNKCGMADMGFLMEGKRVLEGDSR
jgi:hypothetical protein